MGFGGEEGKEVTVLRFGRFGAAIRYGKVWERRRSRLFVFGTAITRAIRFGTPVGPAAGGSERQDAGYLYGCMGRCSNQEPVKTGPYINNSQCLWRANWKGHEGWDEECRGFFLIVTCGKN